MKKAGEKAGFFHISPYFRIYERFCRSDFGHNSHRGELIHPFIYQNL